MLRVEVPTRQHWTVLERLFDAVHVRRADFGYRALYARCWNAKLSGDLAACLELAPDPSLSPDMVATIAPGYQEPEADVELINRVLDHPACSASVASRYATNREPAIRIRVANFPGLLTSTLAVLAVDRDEDVRASAIAVLDGRAAMGL